MTHFEVFLKLNAIFFLQEEIEHLFLNFLRIYSKIIRFLFQKKTKNLLFDFLLNYSKIIQFQNRIFLIVFFLSAFEILDFRCFDDDVENSKKRFFVISSRGMNTFFFGFFKVSDFFSKLIHGFSQFRFICHSFGYITGGILEKNFDFFRSGTIFFEFRIYCRYCFDYLKDFCFNIFQNPKMIDLIKLLKLKNSFNQIIRQLFCHEDFTELLKKKKRKNYKRKFLLMKKNQKKKKNFS